ncbi:MAG: histidinol dehydrogenase, partial [Bacillota bacterium]|nr:histidinol dehydrogenase [Bacillota bacterium]
AGPNHVLPTGGTARFASPLSVDDFIKKSSLIYYSRDALLAAGEDIMLLADREGFQAHKRSVEIRKNQSEKSG